MGGNPFNHCDVCGKDSGPYTRCHKCTEFMLHPRGRLPRIRLNPYDPKAESGYRVPKLRGAP